MPTDNITALMRSHAHAIHAKMSAKGMTVEDFETETVTADGLSVTIQISPAEPEPDPNAKIVALLEDLTNHFKRNIEEPIPRESLTPTERAIIDACDYDEPRKAEQIARAIGRDCNKYFRELLTRLCKTGHLRRSDARGGYLRA